MYDAIVLNKLSYALSGWAEYMSQVLKDNVMGTEHQQIVMFALNHQDHPKLSPFRPITAQDTPLRSHVTSRRDSLTGQVNGLNSINLD